MKAVVFAGGQAKRLSILAKGFNKHLLPIADEAVIERGLTALAAGGIRELLVITNRGWEEAFSFLFRERGGYRFSYIEITTSQRPDLPLADVLYEAKDFTGAEDFLLLFGDNLFLGSLEQTVMGLATKTGPPRIVLSFASDPERFGVPVFKNSRLDHIVEKPSQAWSHMVVTGLAKYSEEVYGIIESLPNDDPACRDLTAVHNVLASQGGLGYYLWKELWLDVGTPGAYVQAIQAVLRGENHQRSQLLGGAVQNLVMEANEYERITAINEVAVRVGV